MSDDPKSNGGRKPLKEKNMKNEPLATNNYMAIYWNLI